MLQRKVVDEDLIIECIKAARESELDAKDDENGNTYSRGHNKMVGIAATDSSHIDTGRSKESADANTKFDESGEEIDFTKITQLALSFRDIYKIDHLRGFENLVELRLDNNLIETMENLSHLVHLRWLDLSFNNITKIEGLEKLRELTDLCLVNNFIPKIENLEHNTKLQVLSMANNCIESVEDNILYLRQFEQLEALNLKGNPMYNHDAAECRQCILAYCESLQFLDYERVQASEVLAAKEAKHEILQSIEAEQQTFRQQQQETREQEIRLAALGKANIADVDCLFEDLMHDDSELLRLQNLPGFEAKVAQFREGADKHTQQYIASVMAVYAEKAKEDALLSQTLTKVCYESETFCIGLISSFESQIPSLSEHNNSSGSQAEVKQQLKSISDRMMEDEMQCVEKINFVISVYEDRIAELTKKHVNHTEWYFAELLSLQNEYNQALLQLIAAILADIKERGIDAVIEPLAENEALRNMIMDKEAVSNSIALSHDNHSMFIGRLEDNIRDKEEKEKKEKIQRQNEEQYQRNRQRISEILIFQEKYAKLFNITMD